MSDLIMPIRAVPPQKEPPRNLSRALAFVDTPVIVQTKINAHLAVTAGLPVLLLALIAAIVSFEFGTVKASQQTVIAMAKLEGTARDAVLQRYLHRVAMRGFVRRLQPSDSAMTAKSRAAANFATLQAEGQRIAGLPALVAHAQSIVLRMSDRDDKIAAQAVRDRQSVIDAYIGKVETPAARSARAALAGNARDAVDLEAAWARIEAAVQAARRDAESAATRSVTLAGMALFATLACTVMVTLAIAFWFRRTSAALGYSETRYSALTEAMPQMIWIHDRAHRLEYVNERWSLYTGLMFTPSLTAQVIFHRDDVADFAVIASGSCARHDVECEARLRHHDGTYRWHALRAAPFEHNAQSAPKWIVTATDIHARKSAETALEDSQAELSHLSDHDPLTSLPNRARLMDRLGRLIAQADRDGGEVVVMYLDLDHFKAINDDMGHNAGDAVLVKTAVRISSALRGDDIASRLAGNEFVLVCPAASGTDAALIAERLQAAVHGQMDLNGRRIVVSCSIGISVYPHDGSQPADLIHKANVAMHTAKADGRGTWCSYRDQTHLPTVPALELEVELLEAIAQQQFVVYYQPIMNVGSERPIGAEALVRWQHPERGLLPPDNFITFAENYGLIPPIGELVLNAACAQLQRLGLRSDDDFTIAVNVSARQFAKPDFVEMVAAAIDAHELDPRRLAIEITESIVMGDAAAVVEKLYALRALGVQLSLDDFGTGYSSLAYIKTFPVDTLKIDRSFVTDIAGAIRDQAIAKTIITLAHSLGMRVIAEGVEQREQLDLLRTFGADCAQGYLFSRPLSSMDFEAYFAHVRGRQKPTEHLALAPSAAATT